VAGGIVFGASRTNAAVGYAIAANSVADEIHRAADDVRTVSSGACLPKRICVWSNPPLTDRPIASPRYV
jgi:hypothetical protein